MSVEVKTPTHSTTSQFEGTSCALGATPAAGSSSSSSKSQQGSAAHSSHSSKKRRQSHTPDERHGGGPGSAKKRRYSASRPRPAMPNFYKGGSVKDPLNLSSLENRTGPSPAPSPTTVAAETARIQSRNVPKVTNITDPLNLNVEIAAAAAASLSGGEEAAVTAELISPTAQMRYKRKRVSKKLLQKLEIDFSDSDGEAKTNASAKSHQTNSSNSESVADRLTAPPDEKSKQSGDGGASDKPSTEQVGADSVSSGANTEVQKANIKSDTGQIGESIKGKVTSDLPNKHKQPQLQTHKFKHQQHSHKQSSSHKQSHNVSANKHSPVSKSKPSSVIASSTPAADKQQGSRKTDNKKKPPLFVHGNYNRYYGYRSADKMETDPRLQAIKPSWLCNKSILDIGCNIGHVTLTIARDYAPERVVGIDIDSKLVSIARKNIRHYQVGPEDIQNYKPFPKGCSSTYGPISAPELEDVDNTKSDSRAAAETNQTNSTKKTTVKNSFPENVTFFHGNYCLESDSLLDTVRQEFDVILAFSVTKWMHLNNGDAGLKRCFKRMYLQLRPGGILIMEPQMWPSYVKKKNLTEKFKKHFAEISLRPDQFTEYLLSAEVGFTTCERLNVQDHEAKGFRRPMFVFHKSAENVT